MFIYIPFNVYGISATEKLTFKRYIKRIMDRQMYDIFKSNSSKIAQFCSDMSIDIDKFRKMLYNVINVNTTSKGCYITINRNLRIGKRSFYGALAAIDFGSSKTGLPTNIFSDGFREITRLLPQICRNYYGVYLP